MQCQRRSAGIGQQERRLQGLPRLPKGGDFALEKRLAPVSTGSGLAGAGLFQPAMP